MRQQLTVHIGTTAVSIGVRGGELLSRAIWLSGQVPPAPLCTGLGRCGRCRVRFVEAAPSLCPAPCEEDVQILGQDAVDAGWRLACRHTVPTFGPASIENALHIVLPETADAPAAANTPNTLWQGRGDGRDCTLAVDLGTTSIHWQCEDAAGRVVGHGHCLNPQAGAGSDVVSRLAFARDDDGRHQLAQAVIGLLEKVCHDAARQGWPVAGMCLAGNTAMTGIVLERDISGLCAAPYRVAHPGHERVCLGSLPPAYVPPLPAPFVGGDVTAGLAWLLAENTPRPFLLADMGTNGELALVTETDRLFLTSVPLGPALEGIGPACGHMAGPDVITGFALGPQGLTPRMAASGGAGHACRGISATGYLDALAHLRRLGLLDAEGHFVPEPPLMPLARKLAQGLHTRNGRPCLALPGEQWLDAGDVELLLKVRACFAVALRLLLAEAGIAANGVQALCLAGALGEHVAPDSLETLGFVPRGVGGRVRAVGNTSLKGAALLARDADAGQRLARWCAGATVLPLAEREDFQKQYMQAMRLEEW